MLIIRGVIIFPSQVESVLLEIGETAPHYLLVADRIDNLDMLEVWVEIPPHLVSDKVKEVESLEKRIKKALDSTLGITANVRLVEPRTLKEAKAK